MNQSAAAAPASEIPEKKSEITAILKEQQAVMRDLLIDRLSPTDSPEYKVYREVMSQGMRFKGGEEELPLNGEQIKALLTKYQAEGAK